MNTLRCGDACDVAVLGCRFYGWKVAGVGARGDTLLDIGGEELTCRGGVLDCLAAARGFLRVGSGFDGDDEGGTFGASGAGGCAWIGAL